MTFAEMVVLNRERFGLNRQEFANKCGIPVELVSYLEDPETSTERLITTCATALNLKVEVFMGIEEEEPEFDEKLVDAIDKARFPNIRHFLIDSPQCIQPEKAIALFGKDRVSVAERNLMLYLSTTALYYFCDTNHSSFAFDEYLFKLHGTLFSRLEKEIDGLALSEEEKQDRIDLARKNVFACDSMGNIAIRIVEPFAEELEKRLPNELDSFKEELDLPFRWDVDDELLKLKIIGHNGKEKDVINLLTVKEREKKG